MMINVRLTFFTFGASVFMNDNSSIDRALLGEIIRRHDATNATTGIRVIDLERSPDTSSSIFYAPKTQPSRGGGVKSDSIIVDFHAVRTVLPGEEDLNLIWLTVPHSVVHSLLSDAVQVLEFDSLQVNRRLGRLHVTVDAVRVINVVGQVSERRNQTSLGDLFCEQLP